MLRRLRYLGAFALGLALGASPTWAQDDTSLTIVLHAEPLNLDPCLIGHPMAGFVTGQNVFETLTTLNPSTGELLPRLATDWSRDDTGAWRFELRPGVHFHDGTDFTANSVATALQRLQEAEFTCSGIINKLDKFELAINVIDDHTIELRADDAPLPLPSYLAHIGIGAASTPMDELDFTPVGTGPYRFVDWVRGERITLERFDDYWGDQPEATSVTYVWRPDANLRAAMVQAGEGDIAVHLAPQDATDPSMDFTYANGETTRIRMVMLPPLDDIRIRKALNLALDRQALIGTVLSDAVVPATQLISNEVLGHNPDLEVWDYDPEKARALIDEARSAGVPVDAELRLAAHPTMFPNVSEVLQVVAQMWNDVGLNVRVDIMERAQWRALVNKPFPDRPAMLIMEQHDNTEGDAVFTMRFRYHTDGGQSEFSNAEVDRLIETAERAEGEERRVSFQEANRIVADEIVPAVPLYHMVNYMRIGPRLDFRPGNFYSAAWLELSRVKFAQGD